ncbi:hypothetical protein HJG60_010783 [Phyllostomus discolor]|uniref:Uncharacterized protein n=1 Tax=Phyllostomus discolor TaxID=89673 RepID=A0A834E6D0_9CHIR|nr:hypothetical protein HJG60_010783 [Phyllostomus discolor]
MRVDKALQHLNYLSPRHGRQEEVGNHAPEVPFTRSEQEKKRQGHMGSRVLFYWTSVKTEFADTTSSSRGLLQGSAKFEQDPCEDTVPYSKQVRSVTTSRPTTFYSSHPVRPFPSITMQLNHSYFVSTT